MSATNERRHGFDLPIRDKDLITGRDARRIVREQVAAEWAVIHKTISAAMVGAIDSAIAEERQRIADAEAERLAAVWYRRLWRLLTQRVATPPAVAGKEGQT